MEPYSTRKSPRLSGYDYGQPGYYYVTICTAQREHRFGCVREGRVWLTHLGKIAAEELEKISEHRPDIIVDKWVVMPNHVHLILRILHKPGRDMTCHVRAPSRGTPQSGSLAMIIGAYKAAVTRRFRAEADMTSHVPTTAVWQGRYYDHVIRCEREYQEIWRYIDENARRWREDEYCHTS